MAGSARLSLRLDPELKDWLEKEAKATDRSAGYIAARAIAAEKARSDARRKAMRKRQSRRTRACLSPKRR